MDLAESDPEGQRRLAAFRAALAQRRSAENIRLEVRWGGGADGGARELIELKPDVIVAAGASSLERLHRLTKTVPIVFVTVIDPVGAGFVASEARPGGNVTGFTALENSVGTKWVQLLKDIDPALERVAVLYDSAKNSGREQLAAIQVGAKSLGVEVAPVGLGDTDEIKTGVHALAGEGDGGIIVPASSLSLLHRDLIIGMAATLRLPAVYSNRPFVASGGLLSYSPDRIDQFRQAAGYVDRILKGERPADLPVQSPTKYELAINLKTAKALGLTVPRTLIARADDVIE